MVAAFLHRFDEVGDLRVIVRAIDGLRLDRTIRHWEPVFARAGWLLSGIYPDVRTGDAAGSALLFNMEKLFETVLGLRVRHACHLLGGGRFSVELQGPVKNLGASCFQLRPDTTLQSGDASVAILDAKWKLLDLGEPNSGVSSGDAYQMNAYASRYRCKQLALVYPASGTARQERSPSSCSRRKSGRCWASSQSTFESSPSAAGSQSVSIR